MRPAPWVKGVISRTRLPVPGMCAKLARCSKLAIRRWRCVCTIAFGRPVVPDVKLMRAQASSGTGGRPRSMSSEADGAISSIAVVARPSAAKNGASAHVVTTCLTPASSRQ
jgi:hypothetical protein